MNCKQMTTFQLCCAMIGFTSVLLILCVGTLVGRSKACSSCKHVLLRFKLRCCLSCVLALALRLPALRAVPLLERGTSGSTYQWALGLSGVSSVLLSLVALLLRCCLSCVLALALRLPAMRAVPLLERGTSGSTYQWALGSSAVGLLVGDVGLLFFFLPLEQL